ncbi:MAG: glutathionylspermidine synthase family protein [Burkholderiales bacterium]|nr:glutathionylspermidine synthase family protein [Burkholderiales bacterium]
MKQHEKLNDYLSIFSDSEALNLSHQQLLRYCNYYTQPASASSVSQLPYFCNKQMREIIIKYSQQIYKCVEEFTGQYFLALNQIDLEVEPYLKSFINKNALKHNNSIHPLIRVDSFIDVENNTIKILEINTGDPSGYSYNDCVLNGLNEQAVIKNFIVNEHINCDYLLPAHYKGLSNSYYSYCATYGVLPINMDNLQVCLVIKENSPVLFDFLCLQKLYQVYFSKRIILATPKELACENNQIYVNDIKIDILIRDYFEDFFQDSQAINPTLNQYILEDKIFIYPPTASILCDNKSALSHLHNIFGDLFPLDANPFLQTFNLHDNNYEFFAQDKDIWVLKPSCGFGGKGVMLGKNMTTEEWRQALLKSIGKEEQYIIQEYTEINRYPRLNSIDFSLQLNPTNFNFWIIEGEYAGAFIRSSSSEVINVLNGGSMASVFFY